MLGAVKSPGAQEVPALSPSGEADFIRQYVTRM